MLDPSLFLEISEDYSFAIPCSFATKVNRVSCCERPQCVERLVHFTFLFCLHLAGVTRWLKSMFNCWEGGTKLAVH